MSALLYHGWGIRNCNYLNTFYTQGTVRFKIAVGDRLFCCPVCKSRNVLHKGKVTRTFNTLPIGSKAISIELDVPRIHCLSCQVTRQIKLPFARATRVFECRLRKKYSNPKLRKLKHIAIDEIYLGKKQKYRTLVLDLKSGGAV